MIVRPSLYCPLTDNWSIGEYAERFVYLDTLERFLTVDLGAMDDYEVDYHSGGHLN